MKFIAKYDINYDDNVIEKDTVVDIVKLWHSEKKGTRYELDTGDIVPASVFNAGFDVFNEVAAFMKKANKI